ncbi:hypothetical protein HKL94_02845 [Candidatus Parcubacteria bacterium]|nr:hypothetical protein [Candidatus Parcubacteria bacterium]
MAIARKEDTHVKKILVLLGFCLAFVIVCSAAGSILNIKFAASVPGWAIMIFEMVVFFGGVAFADLWSKVV